MPKEEIREVEGGGIYFSCPTDGTGYYDASADMGVDCVKETADTQRVTIVFRCDNCGHRHSFTIIGKEP